MKKVCSFFPYYTLLTDTLIAVAVFLQLLDSAVVSVVWTVL